MPRTVLGVLVGVALGLSGAVMQGVTRNPLADPGILGIEAGASLAVVISIYTFGVTSLTGYVWFAFAGAAVASVVVYTLGAMGRGGATPIKLALAGAALASLLGVAHHGGPPHRPGHARPVPVLGGRLAGRPRKRRWSSRCSRSSCVGTVLALGVGPVPQRPRPRRRRGSVPRPARAARPAPRPPSPSSMLCGAAVAAAGPIAFVGLTDAARGAGDLRPRLPLGAAVVDGAGADPPARRRHHRAGRRPARRAAGRDRHRADRRARSSSPSCAAASWRSSDGQPSPRLPAQRPPGRRCGGRASGGRPGSHTRAVWSSLVVLRRCASRVFAWSLSVGDFPIPIRRCAGHARRPRHRGQRLHRAHPAPAPRP